MFTIRATKKLRDRVKAPLQERVEPSSTVLGDWYATALFWKPQVALFVDEATLVPVLMPLAPAKTLPERFGEHLEAVLNALGTDPRFVADEVAATTNAQWAKTENRSVVGMMNEFSFLAETDRAATTSWRWLPGSPTPRAARSTSATRSPTAELEALIASDLSS